LGARRRGSAVCEGATHASPALIAHRSIVSIGFKASGILMGAPAIAACVALMVAAVQLHQAAKPDGEHMISIQTYGIAGLLTDAGVGLDHTFGFLAGLAGWLATGLAVVALTIALSALLLYLVGRGVGRAALWARIVGGALAFVLALASLLAFTSLPHRLIALPIPAMAIALYTLWTLIWRFKTPTLALAPEVAADGPRSSG
jgi:hypothetical protein